MLLADANPLEEGGQLGQSCDNGATQGTSNVSGTINGNLTVSAGQQCTYTSPCEITGDLTINGDPSGVLPTGVWLDCTVDGNLTDNAGMLVLAPVPPPSASGGAIVRGNVQISGASAFSIGPSVQINGNLQIQNLPANEPQPGTVCKTTVQGNVQVNNNASPIQIGGTNAQSCTGNAVGGNLLVDANTAAVWIDYNTVAGALHVDNDSATTDVSGNSVGKNMECESNNTVTHVSPNMVSGQAQGQCARFPQ